MNHKIEMIIDNIKDSLEYVDLGYSGGQSVDRMYCSICGADDIIKYNTKQNISMDTIEHTNDCAYSLIRELEKQLEE